MKIAVLSLFPEMFDSFLSASILGRARTNGLTGWLLLGAGILAVALAYQYLETEGLVSVPVLRAVLSINGQVVLTEGAALGYLCTTAVLYRPRRLPPAGGERAGR